VVVPDDWDGPIGLSWALAHPERVSGLFITPTLMGRAARSSCHCRCGCSAPPGGVGEVLVKGLHMFVRVFAFRVGVVHRKRLRAGVRSACLAPHPTRSSPRGVFVFSHEIPASGTAPVALTGRLERRFATHA